MQERAFLSRPTFLVAGALLGLWILSPGLAHAVLSKDDQKCVNEVNKNIEKVGKAVNKDISKCLKDGQKADLSGTIEECITSDLKKKVVKATDKLAEKVPAKCLNDPNFPPIDTADTAGMNTRSIQKEYDLAHKIFGDPIDAAAADFATEKDDAKCQQAVYKQAAKCQKAKLKSYNKCKKDGLKGKTPPGLITSAQQLEDASFGTSKYMWEVGKVCADGCRLPRGLMLVTFSMSNGNALKIGLARCDHSPSSLR